MPRKTFANGFPLPASDLNTYLMDQSVQTYADATARTAALPTPVEGQVSYLADTNTAYVYDGTSWNAVVDAKNYGSVLPNGAAGRNKIINGAFDFWQRGTSVSWASSTAGYLADRWYLWSSGTTTTGTLSRQAFTPGSAPAAGYEAEYFMRVATTTISGAAIHSIWQKMEDVRTFAGQTVTMSFWAKADATRTFGIRYDQLFGTGGSSEVVASVAVLSATTSWQRFTVTFTFPSIAGKTIGAGSSASVLFDLPQVNGSTFDIWGVQVEAGSIATPFARAGGTLQGELAACQRYYWRTSAVGTSGIIGNGSATATTNVRMGIKHPITLRTYPTAIEYSTLAISDGVTGIVPSSITLTGGGQTGDCGMIDIAVTGATQYRPYYLLSNGSAAAYIGFSAEL